MKISRDKLLVEAEIEKEEKVGYDSGNLWIEEVTDEPLGKELYEKLMKLADVDGLVCKYQDREEMNESIYPVTYNEVLPKSVIKALRYLRYVKCP